MGVDLRERERHIYELTGLDHFIGKILWITILKKILKYFETLLGAFKLMCDWTWSKNWKHVHI